MTRDWDVIREILLRFESTNTPNSVVTMNDFENIDQQIAAYHIRLLKDYGCIEASVQESFTGDNLIGMTIAKRLTPKGHDLLDSIRNESMWGQIKEKIKSKGIDMTIDAIMIAGKSIMKSMFT